MRKPENDIPLKTHLLSSIVLEEETNGLTNATGHQTHADRNEEHRNPLARHLGGVKVSVSHAARRDDDPINGVQRSPPLDCSNDSPEEDDDEGGDEPEPGNAEGEGPLLGGRF